MSPVRAGNTLNTSALKGSSLCGERLMTASLSFFFLSAMACPSTGGISAANAPEWLAMKQVLCVGGSWVAPADASPEQIVALAREASGLGQGHTGQ